MKNNNQICDLKMISPFYDNELEQEEYNRVKDHINGCPRCKEALTDLTNISSPVKDYLLNNMPQPQFARIENSVLNKIHQKKTPLREKIFHLFILKRTLLPAAALASIMIFFAVFFQAPDPSGPSAIVSSLSGDISSIIIMETPNTHQTILWFNEPKHPERRKI